MATNLQIINDALREINVISETKSASDEQGSTALRKLNQMLEAWKEDDIDFGWYAQTSTSGTAPIPDYAERAVTLALAGILASQYGANPLPTLIAEGEARYRALKRKSINDKLENTDMSHLPQGSGHFGTDYDINSDT